MVTSRHTWNEEAPAPFVGRERERAEICRALEGVASGSRGRLFFVRGEPGIGKTRLVEETVREAEARGVVVSWGESQDSAGAPAYGPWTQVLRGVHERLGSAERAKSPSASREFLARILPEVLPRGATQEGAQAENATESPDSRFRLFESVTSYLASAASIRPLMLVVEDLHAADVSSLLLMHFAARELRQTPIVLVGTYRDPGPWLDDERRSILARASGEGAMVSLKGLADGDVSRLADALLGEKVPEDFVRALHEATGGNALLIDGTLRTLKSAEDSRSAFARARLSLPGSARESVREWVGYLSPAAREALEIAAVLGGEVSLERTATTAGIPLDSLDGLLEEARKRGFVTRHPRSPLRARFRHGLIRETLYEELPGPRRQALHRRAAEVLESEPGAGQAAELAYHYLRAAPSPGAARKAFSYARQAARDSLDRFAWEDAAAHFRGALEALRLDGDGGRDRCETLIELAEALSRAGDFVEARSLFADAFESAEAIGVPGLMVRAAIGHYGPIGRAGNDPESHEMLRRVLGRVGNEDLASRALLLGRLAISRFRGETAGASAALMQEAIETARRSGNPAALAETLLSLSYLHVSDPRESGRLELATELLELGIREGNVDWQQWGRVHRFMELVEIADLPAAEAEAGEVTRTAESLRQPFWFFGANVLQAILSGIAGRFDRCLELADESARLGRGAGEVVEEVRLLQRAFLAIELDRPEDLEPVSRFLDVPAGAERAPLVRFAWEAGHRDEARRTLEALAADGFASLLEHATWCAAAAMLAPVCDALGERTYAARLHELMLPFAERVLRVGVPGFWALGPGALFLGMHAATAGLDGEAERHLEVSFGISTRMGARPWVAHTRTEQARLCARRGDRRTAAAHLAEAERIARDLGMKALLRKIAGLAR